MFNDTSYMLINIPSINLNLKIKHTCISDIFPAELQPNKGNSCGKETPFLDLNIR